jgi:hypothetical protein
MLILCGAAAGLVLLGGARAVLGGGCLAVRVSAVGACALAPGAIVAALGYPTAGEVAAAVVALTAVASALVGNAAVRARAAAIAGKFGRRGVQAAGLAVAGTALLVGSLARYERGYEADVDASMADLEEVTWKPPLGAATGIAATTDAGRPVELLEPMVTRLPAEARVAEARTLANLGAAQRMIRLQPATDGCNCHGWVFAGGRYWLGPDDVEHILTDNGYNTVSDPRPGDVAIYREGGTIVHTGIVRTGGAGTPVLVESKWGWMGVFLHRPEDTCYGLHYTFYRGPRELHTIAGLAAPSPPGAGGAAPAALVPTGSSVAGH